MRRRNLFQAVYLALASAWLAAGVSLAAVTTTGQVSPSDPATWTATTVAIVGETESGSLLIEGGSTVESQSASLGYESGVTGAATVSGAGSAWNNSGSISVGRFGVGQLRIEDGATASNGTANIGGSIGEATVTGAGSTWQTTGSLNIGRSGVGTLSVEDGASVYVSADTYVGWEQPVQNPPAAGTGHIHLDNGTLTTRSLFTSFDRLSGAGDIYARGVAVDQETLRFDSASGLQPLITLDGPGQDITIHLDMSGEDYGTLTAGYRDTGAITITDGVSVRSAHGYLGYLAGAYGSATVSGAGSRWETDQSIDVGLRGGGTLNVADGAHVRTYNTYLGYFAGSSGEVTVTGKGSLLEAIRLEVGRHGAGTMTIEDGSRVWSLEATIGSIGSSDGKVIVRGAGSSFEVATQFRVGYPVNTFNTGTLLIEDGGLVTSGTGDLNGSALISGVGSVWDAGSIDVSGHLAVKDGGYVTTSSLTVSGGVTNVTGDGSVLDAAHSLRIGYAGGPGELSIGEGAVVNSTTATLGGIWNAASGTAHVTGAGATWNIKDRLEVGSSAPGTITIADGGVVDVGMSGYFQQVTLTSGAVTLSDDGALRLHGGAIQRSSGAATFNFNGGRLEGVRVYNVGVGLTQNGGVLAPGNTAGLMDIVGSYVLNDGALEIELLSGSGAAGVGFDQLVVNNGVTLGAESQLNLVLDYAATVGDSFLIVDSRNSNAISGTFANEDALVADHESLRYSFALDYTAGTGNDIALTVASVALIGDYNGDGLVDAGDYTVWRDAVGSNVAAYAGADGNGDGVVDDEDQAVWANHYGASIEAALAQAVPEPGGVGLAVLAAIIGGCRRKGFSRSAS